MRAVGTRRYVYLKLKNTNSVLVWVFRGVGLLYKGREKRFSGSRASNKNKTVPISQNDGDVRQ